MNFKKVIFLAYITLTSGISYGQQLIGTSSGEVSFYSDTPLETIQAVNKKTACLINMESGEIAVQMRIIDFDFPNKLMKEHFNENYLESEKYPTATFKGKIRELEKLNEQGQRQVTAVGNMKIHGVNQEVEVKGTLESLEKANLLQFKFTIKPEEYNVEIPNLVLTKIAEEIEITGKFNLVYRD